MIEQRGFWDVEYRLEELLREGGFPEKLATTVDFEMLRPILLRTQHSRDCYEL